jgi:hypothetical protein
MHEFQANSPDRQPRPRFEDTPDFALRAPRGRFPAWAGVLIGLGVVFLVLLVLGAGFFAHKRQARVQEMSNNADFPAPVRDEIRLRGDASRPNKVALDEAFVTLLKNADKAVLYEGLPHQKHERALVKKERETKKTQMFGDFYFYEESLELKDPDSEAMRDIISDPETFQPYTGGCGSYHPDYLVEWYADGETGRVYLCFGCGEAKVAGPNGETRYSLSRAAQTKLQDVLLAYHKNRPDSEGWLKMTKDYRDRRGE